MKDGNECDNCNCDHHMYRPIKVVFGIIIALIVLAFVFWAVRAVLGLAFGIGVGSPTWHLIIGVIAVFFVIWLVCWIIRWPLRFMHGGFSNREFRILRRRYAKGEISESQFKRMMKNLKEQR